MSAQRPVELALRQALAYLWRADVAWQHADPSAPGPLHWPVAIREAKRALSSALEALRSTDQCDAGKRPTEDALSSPEDARAGMRWFNGLTPAERSYWLMCAQSARPADAWRTFQAWEARP